MKPPSLDLQMEEVLRSIACLPQLEGRHQRKAVIEFRINVLRGVCRTLAWLKENDADIRAFVAQRVNQRIIEAIEQPMTEEEHT